MLNAAQEAFAVAPAAHVGQERARDVLEREIEVGNSGGEDGLNELVGQARWIEVEESGPGHPGLACYRACRPRSHAGMTPV